MHSITEPVFSVSDPEIKDTSCSSNDFFSIASISLFLFLATLWITVAPGWSSLLHSVSAVLGTILALAAGVVLSIIGIIRRGANRRGSVTAGLTGLGFNGFFLLAVPVFTAAQAMQSTYNSPPTSPVNDTVPAVAASQPSDAPTCMNIVQTKVEMTLNMVAVVRPTVVDIHQNIVLFHPAIARAPIFILRPTQVIPRVQPMFVPMRTHPVFIPMPMRHF